MNLRERVSKLKAGADVISEKIRVLEKLLAEIPLSFSTALQTPGESKLSWDSECRRILLDDTPLIECKLAVRAAWVGQVDALAELVVKRAEEEMRRFA